jgi:hypothetical protein
MRKQMATKRWTARFLVFGFWTLSVTIPARAAGIGVVTGVQGEATVRRDRVAQAQRLKFKDDLFWLDTLSTGTAGRLRLLILQKSVITMKELSRLQLREEPAGPAQPKKKSVVELVSGAVRVVVDKEALTESDYEVQTNLAVAAIRGSDLFGQKSSEDRVEFCTGPDSTVTAVHRDPSVGRRELTRLQCAAISPDRIQITDITLDTYRDLTRETGPSGPQNDGHQESAENRIAPPSGDAGGEGTPGDPNNPYSITAGCLLCNNPRPPPNNND